MNLTEWSKELYETAKSKGWHDHPRSFGDVVALCHSELSEALEEYRNNQPMFYYINAKPEGQAIEMIDCLIRILDWAGANDLDVEELVQIKHAYNKTRSHRHGGKSL